MGINPTHPERGAVRGVCRFLPDSLCRSSKRTADIAFDAFKRLTDFINEYENFILSVGVFHLQDCLFSNQSFFPSLATAFTLGAASALFISSIKRIYQKLNPGV